MCELLTRSLTHHFSNINLVKHSFTVHLLYLADALVKQLGFLYITFTRVKQTDCELICESLLSGYAGYKLCYQEVLKVVKGIVHQPLEVKGSSVFYAFSYYYDRAVDSGLIGEWGYIWVRAIVC